MPRPDRSPFPGMDPYLESPAHWADFHARFINAVADAINDRVPDRYVARINEHVMAIAPLLGEDGDDDGGDQTVYMPDVTVLADLAEPAMRLPAGGSAAAASAVLTPVTMENVRHADDHTEAYLELVRLPEMAVVTVLELLSPTNKYGAGRGLYLDKRRQFLARPVHVVELDLLRAGARLRFARPLPAGHYHGFVSRADHRPTTDVYTWSVRDPLPELPIPLQSPDADVRLPLGEPLAVAYAAGRYRRLIDYAALLPRPPFATADAPWVATTAKTPAPR